MSVRTKCGPSVTAIRQRPDTPECRSRIWCQRICSAVARLNH